MNNTASTEQLSNLLEIYKKILPMSSFPYVPFIIAAVFQSLAWVSGPIFLQNFTLGYRMILLILFAVGEYLFMSPAMNAGAEILNMSESFLVTEYHITTLIVFIFVSIFIFKKKFEIKYFYAFIGIAFATYFANKS